MAHSQLQANRFLKYNFIFILLNTDRPVLPWWGDGCLLFPSRGLEDYHSDNPEDLDEPSNSQPLA